jgi:DNA polymerase (family X)
MPDKKEVIVLLESLADMMEYKGENKFKVAAFRKGAVSLRRMDEKFETVIEEKSLGNVKGIGKGLQAVIYEFIEKGESSLYKELKQDVPEGIDQLLKIKGLKPGKIQTLYTELGISSIGELEYACKENRLALLKGFGEATQEKILKEIERFKFHSKFVLLNTGLNFAEEIEEKISKYNSVLKYSLSGELRRGIEIISAIHFVVLISDQKAFLKDLKKNFEIEFADDKAAARDYFNIPITFHMTYSEQDYFKELFLSTGSAEFISGMDIIPDKLKEKSEENIFKKFSMPYVIPEMREKEYFEKKKKNLKENSRLSREQFKGLLHFHSTYSDGRNTLFDMLDSAKKNNFEYAAICDHSKSAFYANGLKEDRILLQSNEIKQISKRIGLTVFQGIESDILQNGDLDYSDDFLKTFDFIVASIHSRYNMTEMTDRMIKAIENPLTDLLAHPSGRLLLSRDPYKFDTKKIIDACSANNVAIEINSNPRRLDIDWRWIYYAREKGVLFSINPDAHSIEEIDYIRYGIMMGRKGGLQPEEVINCFSKEDFIKFLNRKVTRQIDAG